MLSRTRGLLKALQAMTKPAPRFRQQEQFVSNRAASPFRSNQQIPRLIDPRQRTTGVRPPPRRGSQQAEKHQPVAPLGIPQMREDGTTASAFGKRIEVPRR